MYMHERMLKNYMSDPLISLAVPYFQLAGCINVYQACMLQFAECQIILCEERLSEFELAKEKDFSSL